MLNRKNLYLGLFIFIFGISSVAMINAPDNKVANSELLVSKSALTLEGTVTDSETDSVLAGIEISIEELALTAKTDDEGNFIFTKLAEGETYTLKVEEDGFEDYEETIEATADTPILEVDVALTPEE